MPGVLLQQGTEENAEATPMEVKEAAAEKEPEAPAARAVVGIIYPPPEVRNIVDKTADFVARNGPEFEERIRLNEAGNSKFNFLNKTDPYHAYYQHKINDIREGVAQEQLAAQQPGYVPPAGKGAPALILEPEVPKDPLPDYDFVVEPPTISAMELDIVKLTAQFVAKNGASFLDKLMMREQRNYQFDFLRKQHPLFVYFTKLVEQYSRILLPPYNMTSNLRKDMEEPSILLDRSQQRMLWEQYQKKQQQKAEEEEEKKRLEYAQIDWHDFVIVETINFKENETGYLPPPIRPTQLAQRLLQQSKFERLAEEGGEVQEIEMEVDEQEQQAEQAQPAAAATEEKEEEASAKPPPSQPPSKQPTAQPPVQAPKGPVQVRRDYDPKAAQPTAQGTNQDQFLISPITGEKIPAGKMQEHMRYGLLDPKWLEDSKKQVDSKKTQEEVFAEGMQISSNLKLLAERRTDIFGMEETVIGQKIGEEEAGPKPPTVQWDGHAASADAISREARSNIDEQMKVIQKAKEQAEKEQVGPILKTPVNAAPPAHPPPSAAPPVSRPPPSRPPEMPRPAPPMMRPPTGPPMGMQQQRPLRPPLVGGPGPGPGPDMRRPPMQMMPPPGMPGNRPLLPPHPGPHGPPGMMMHPPMHPMMGGPPPHQPPMQPPPFGGPPPHPAPPSMAPPPKRPHTESEDLIPEQEFVSKHPGPVGFKVLVPNMPDRPEWKLNGQMIPVTLPITDPVSVIKAKISDELGMPSGKQKLQIGQLFIKDSLSLAYYNFTVNTVVQLGLKERGGRKK